MTTRKASRLVEINRSTHHPRISGRRWPYREYIDLEANAKFEKAIDWQRIETKMAEKV